MNNIKNNFKGNNLVEYCRCDSKLYNKQVYECIVLNNSEKKIPYEGRLCELKYIVNMLKENQEKHERFTLALVSKFLSC